jgi:hypothetical protein
VSRWPTIRDTVLFTVGVLGICYEAVIKRPPDYGLLPVFAALCGLPAFLGRDTDGDGKIDEVVERKNKRRKPAGNTARHDDDSD